MTPASGDCAAMIRRIEIARFVAALFKRRAVEIILASVGMPGWMQVSKAHKPPIFAKAGEKIVCDGVDQHEIATFLKTVKTGEMFSATSIGKWKQPEPLRGATLPIRCEICWRPWVWHGQHFRFKDGWR